MVRAAGASSARSSNTGRPKPCEQVFYGLLIVVIGLGGQGAPPDPDEITRSLRAYGYTGPRLLGLVQLPAVVPSVISSLRSNRA